MLTRDLYPLHHCVVFVHLELVKYDHIKYSVIHSGTQKAQVESFVRSTLEQGGSTKPYLDHTSSPGSLSSLYRRQGHLNECVKQKVNIHSTFITLLRMPAGSPRARNDLRLRM